MSLPPPHTLGAPAKFDQWRGGQDQLLLRILASPKRVVAACFPTGIGKCHGPEVPIRKYDGGIVQAQHVRKGDLLIGPDGLPREVLSLGNGQDDMFRVIPTKGETWTMNSEHMLTLVQTNTVGQPVCASEDQGGSIVDVGFQEWLSWSKRRKHIHKLFRVGVDWGRLEAPLEILPYDMGMLLGDGSLDRQVGVTTQDPAVVQALLNLAAQFGDSFRISGAECAAPTYFFKGMGVRSALMRAGAYPLSCDTKHVPLQYLMQTRGNLLQLLAGLIDTDGCTVSGGYEFVSKSPRLAEDVVFIARSLGWAAYIKPTVKGCQTGAVGLYWRVIISGCGDEVPVRIGYKVGPTRRQKKDVLRTSFRVEPIGRGEYFGFTLDGDGRYLLGDFTVTHNTLLGNMAGKLMGARSVYLTSTKGLEDQVEADYQETGLVDVRGMNNYPCHDLNNTFGHRPYHTCDDGPCLDGARCDYREGGCDYYDAVRRAESAGATLTNYAMWITRALKGEGFGDRDLLIADEAHDAPSEISSRLRIEITEAEWALPHGDLNLREWQDWARDQHKLVQEEISRMGPGRGRRKRKNLLERLTRLMRARGDWVTKRTRYGWSFEPLWPGDYAEQLLFRGIPKVLLMSATIRPQTLAYLGLSEADYDFIDSPSPFAISNRLVTQVPTVRMTHKATPDDMDTWATRIDQIISQRLDRKGIIHTVSYERARYITAHSSYRGLMIEHDSKTTREQVERFKQMPAPAILVSPSVSTGWDFPLDDCRYQIIAKIPWPDQRDPVMAARVEKDPDYGAYLALTELVQMSGRGVRSSSDWAETLVVDDSLVWMLGKYARMLPQWWRDAYRKVKTVPSPPLRMVG